MELNTYFSKDVCVSVKDTPWRTILAVRVEERIALADFRQNRDRERVNYEAWSSAASHVLFVPDKTKASVLERSVDKEPIKKGPRDWMRLALRSVAKLSIETSDGQLPVHLPRVIGA